MATQKLINNIEKNDKQNMIVMLTNIVKMINNRKLLNNFDQTLTNMLNQYKNKDEKVYEIKTKDKEMNIFIKFVNGKLTTIRKIPNIDEYFVKGKNKFKLVVVKDINQKAYKQFMEYKDTEVFWEKNLKINLIDHHIVPKHILMSNEDKEEFLKSTGIKKKDMAKINVTDPVSRYYNAKVGDVFKIIRESITSGYSTHYRIVKNSSLFNDK